jgi:8-amino-7-oxononanoate synthase
MDSWRLRAQTERVARLQAERLRSLEAADSASATTIEMEGRTLKNFASNDYLSLRMDVRLRVALAEGAMRYGTGAGASHLLGGHHREHELLAQECAQWLGCERALVFGSGYVAAVATLTALLRPGDLTVQDRLNHACLLDGARFAGAEVTRYRHLDFEHARVKLHKRKTANLMLISDSVFSMDGDCADVAMLSKLADEQGALLMIDEAHALGVLGERGAGLSAQLPQSDRIVMATFGKAIGTSGAVIAGPAWLIDHLVQAARGFVYSTAMPPALAYATREALRLAQTADQARAHLAELVARFRAGLARLSLSVGNSMTPIQPIYLASEREALRLSMSLRNKGFFVPAVRPPTVPKAMLRVSLNAAHQAGEVDELLDALYALFLGHGQALCPDHAGRQSETSSHQSP